MVRLRERRDDLIIIKGSPRDRVFRRVAARATLFAIFSRFSPLSAFLFQYNNRERRRKRREMKEKRGVVSLPFFFVTHASPDVRQKKIISRNGAALEFLEIASFDARCSLFTWRSKF